MLTRLSELTSRDLGIGWSGVTPAAEHTSDARKPLDKNHSPSPEAGTTGVEEIRSREATSASDQETSTAT